MDSAYITWMVLIALGVALAFFARPKHILVCGAVLMACALAGLVVSGFLGTGSLATLFGVAATAIPVVFGMLAIGASIGASVVARARRKTEGS